MSFSLLLSRPHQPRLKPRVEELEPRYLLDVSLVDHGSTVTLANGTITATIMKAQAKITSMRYAGVETVQAGGNIYYSMDGGSSYEVPSNCVYSIIAQTPDLVDISLKSFYTNQPHAFDKDIHYVLRSGDSGVYTYAVLDHPATYPATSVGEWRQVWKLPHNSTNFTFERIYVDALRNWEMPSYYDVTHASPTSIAEIIRLNTGVRAGLYDGKYEYAANYWDLNTWGHASNINNVGVWMVFGSHEWFNDGPTKQDLTSASGIIHVHFGMNHYGGSGTSVAAGESWSKIYGPHLLYCNSSPAGGDAMWADAQTRAQAEQAAWPYSWLTNNSNYPLANGRGTVTGTFTVNDPLKPDVSGANAWIGLAQPSSGGNWQYESKRYQYWVKTDDAGNFSIPNVRPGTYTLSAFVTGAVGEYSQTGVSVTAGATTSLGNVTWNVVHPGTSIAWEIGVPDRSAAKFWHGNDYFQGFTWDLFANEFPNPLVYSVGTSNWATDWNYVQSAYVVNGVRNNWAWQINFNLDNVPTSGNATLTTAWASTDSAAIQVFVNDPDRISRPLRDFYPSVGGGNALVRQGVHAKYGVDYTTIPVALLRQGSNSITLVMRRGVANIADHVMYDYLNLEVPGTVGNGAGSAAPGRSNREGEAEGAIDFLRAAESGIEVVGIQQLSQSASRWGTLAALALSQTRPPLLGNESPVQQQFFAVPVAAPTEEASLGARRISTAYGRREADYLFADTSWPDDLDLVGIRERGFPL